MSVAVYLRVSSRTQRHVSQEGEIRRWLEGNGIDIAAVAWYRDVETGKKLDRPEFNRLRGDIFDGKVKTVVVWKLDRLSRRLKDGIDIISDWCDRGVRIVSTTQQIDLSGAVGRMVAAVMLGLAEIELEYRQERQAAGIRAAKKRGVYAGRKVGTTKKSPARAAELHAKGLTAPEIAEAMGVSLRTVWRYLEQAPIA
jgi:DNA invertase Pin-like site-specific DNA recombinase